MTKALERLFFFYILMLIAVLGAVSLMPGALYVDRHEGDTLHLVEIVMRMGLGQTPHLDFVTPLGVFGFLPIVAFVWAGFGVGTSILWGQIAFALFMTPMVWWAAYSRLSVGMAYAFGTGVVVMALAMIHGEIDPHVSLSMHYNRWAWAFSFVAILVAVLPARGRGSETADGLILGFAMSFFILAKVTYAVAFFPGILAALLLGQRYRTLFVGAALVLLSALAVVVAYGLEFWPAYIGDLLLVSGTEIRPRAGETMISLLTGPKFLLGNLLLFAAIIFLRGGARPEAGLLLILFAPGFLYVTYQNYGNDPKWLLLLVFLSAALAEDWKLKCIALSAAVIILPSFWNMGISPARHLGFNTEIFEPAFPDTVHDDFLTQSDRVWQVRVRQPVTFESEEFAYLNELAPQEDWPDLQGENLPVCLQELGLFGTMRAIVKDMEDKGLAEGKTVFAADTFGSHWLFGDLDPTKGGAPWYYGELTGFQNADYFLVPTCPTTPRAFRSILNDLNDLERISLTKLVSAELYWLYEIER